MQGLRLALYLSNILFIKKIEQFKNDSQKTTYFLLIINFLALLEIITFFFHAFAS
jgi:hypothetical protein